MSSPSPPPPLPRRGGAGGFFAGLGIPLGGAVVMAWIGFTQNSDNVILGILIGMGLAQFLYVVPLYRYAKRTGQESMKAGLVVGAGLVFLFSASCGGLMAMFSGTSFH